jgi:hypothetical protein
MIAKTTSLRKQIKSIVLLPVLIFLLHACTQEKMNIPDTGRKLVVNGFLSSDSILKVQIGKSGYISDEGAYADSASYFVKNANVYIQHDNRIDTLHYIPRNNPWGPEYGQPNLDTWFRFGNYTSTDIVPIPGHEYSIIVKAAGLPDATAKVKIPNFVAIDRVDTLRYTETVLPDMPYKESMKFSIEFTDPPNENNYYLFSIWKAPFPTYNNNRNLTFYCNDPIVEEKIDYLSSHFYVKTSDWPYLGIAFTDKVINGQKYRLEVSVLGIDIGCPFYFNADDPENHRKTIYLKLYSITEDTYLYIQSLNLYNKNYGNPLTNPVIVNSNITGGYGIFAGASLAVDSIVFKY